MQQPKAWPGFEIDHSERSSRVAISRAAGPSGARNTSEATQQHTPTGGAPRGTPPVNTSQPIAVNQHSLRRQRLGGTDLGGPAAGQPGGDERGHDGDDAHADQL